MGGDYIIVCWKTEDSKQHFQAFKIGSDLSESKVDIREVEEFCKTLQQASILEKYRSGSDLSKRILDFSVFSGEVLDCEKKEELIVTEFNLSLKKGGTT